MKKLLKKLKESWLDYLIIFISVGAICFVYLFTAFYQPKESDKNINKENIVKVLRDKKQRDQEYWLEETYYINLLTYSAIHTNENGYINNSGNFVSSSVLTLSKGIVIFPDTYYVYDSDTHQVCYLIFYDLYGNFIASQTKQGVFQTPSNAHLVRLSIFTNQLSSARLYIGNHIYQDYTPPLNDIFDELNDYYSDMGYHNGYDIGYDIGYNEAFQEQEDYYKELIIPEIQKEYEEIGYNNGYYDAEIEYEETIIPEIQKEYEEIGYNNGYDIGYDIGLEYGQQLGYNNGYNDGVASASNNFNIMDFLRSLFDLVWGVLNVEMLPNIKLMYIVSIPLVLSVIKFILGWFR